MSAGASEQFIGKVGGLIGNASVEFTRPANTTDYTAGDVVSNNATTTVLMEFANLFREYNTSGYLVGARLMTDKKSITPRIRVHLFNASDATVAADNAAHKELYADGAKRLGYFDLPAMTTATNSTDSDMSRAIDLSIRVPVACSTSSRSLFCLLEALDGFTPASGQKFTLKLALDQN